MKSTNASVVISPEITHKPVETIVWRDREIPVERLVYQDREVAVETIVYRDREVPVEKIVFRDAPPAVERMTEVRVPATKRATRRRVVDETGADACDSRGDEKAPESLRATVRETGQSAGLPPDQLHPRGGELGHLEFFL